MSIRGIDIASHQGPDFAFAGQGDFVIIKASGGHSYKNEHLAAQVAGARKAGMVVGFYHYMFEPSLGGGDVRREVTNFIEAVRPHVQPGTTFWLDVEEFAQAVGYTGNLGDWIVAFCEAVEREYGCACGIYCATWYLVPTGLSKDLRLRKYPFWMASWQDALPAPSFMAPWDRVTLWQYNADGVDKDLFFGTREEFLALGVPAPKSIEKKVETFQHAPGFLDPIVDTFGWGGAGIVTYRKVRAYNDQERKYYEREWSAEGGYTPWVEVK